MIPGECSHTSILRTFRFVVILLLAGGAIDNQPKYRRRLGGLLTISDAFDVIGQCPSAVEYILRLICRRHDLRLGSEHAPLPPEVGALTCRYTPSMASVRSCLVTSIGILRYIVYF